MSKLLGVVLCGGQSQRMGRDKGLISIQETVWANYVAAKLKAQQLSIVVSVNPAQVDSYSRIFPAEQLVIDTVAGVEGPLQGLLSVHHHYPQHDLLLLACDMIDMEPATLAQLISTYQTDASHDFYAFSSGDFLEPFGAIYTAAGLKVVMEQVTAGEGGKLSLMRTLKSGNTRGLPLQDSSSFRNYNTL